MVKNEIVIVIDQREQTPIRFPDGIKTEGGSLYSGDYSVKSLEHIFSVERKSIDDLCGSLTTGRDRFERELHRLRGYRFKRVLIVGGTEDTIKRGEYRSKAHPNSILGSMETFEVRYDIPFVYAETNEEAAEIIIGWAQRFSREVLKDAQGLLNKDATGL